MRLPITRERIRNHLHYAWWQYAALIAGAIIFWNLLYTTTRYRTPEYLKVEFYCEAAATNEDMDRIDAMLEEVRQQHMPDMEEVTFTTVGYDDTYGQMQLMVWMAAGQGDLYMLSTEKFLGVADQGSMIDLQPYVDSGLLNVEGIDLSAGYVTISDTGERILAGIPADSLSGFHDYALVGEDHVLSILNDCGSEENTLKLLNWFLENMK